MTKANRPPGLRSPGTSSLTKRARTSPPALAGRLESTASYGPKGSASPRRPGAITSSASLSLYFLCLGGFFAIRGASAPPSSSLLTGRPFLQALRSEIAQASRSLSLKTSLACGEDAAMEIPIIPVPQPASRMDFAEHMESSLAISLRRSLVPVSTSNEEKRAWDRSNLSLAPL